MTLFAVSAALLLRRQVAVGVGSASRLLQQVPTASCMSSAVGARSLARVREVATGRVVLPFLQSAAAGRQFFPGGAMPCLHAR